MTYRVEYTITAEDFRQKYTPPPEAGATVARHWMLDFGPGRDMLKAVLRRNKPDLKVPYLRRGEHLDGELDAVIDQLGFRNMTEPVDSERLAVAHQFMKLMFSAMFGAGRSAQLA